MGVVRRYFMDTLLLTWVIFMVCCSLSSAEGEAVHLAIRTDEPIHEVSPLLYGLFFEDINFGADGGLYAELVRNRSFEFEESLFGWSKVEDSKSKGQIQVMELDALNENNPHYLRLTVLDAEGRIGMANGGYGGIAVEKGKDYHFSVYARSVVAFGEGFTVHLEKDDGTVIGKCKVEQLSDEWEKYSAEITAEESAENARLVLLAEGNGTVDIDMVSLFPEDTWKGQSNGLRKDLVEMLAAMKPAFIRFPGGCVVEGKYLADAYCWKDTIGEPAERKVNWNLWAEAGAPQYYQSYGLGFFEYFRLCEDLGAEPVPTVNCGMSCQARDVAELAPMEELEKYVQDALDLIEYANGPADSEWGSKRAEAGHPEPFNLKYIGIGNEQWGEQYFERYNVFYKAIKAKYPDIKVITTSGPSAEGRWFDLAWSKFRSGTPAEIVDEHYYRPPQWLLSNSRRYDSYDRGGAKVFLGEYAAHNSGRRNNVYAAICEAAYMTGLERNSDVVVMASYAPLLAKIGSTQWRPDLIWFDNTGVYGTPSYYVQKLFSRNTGDTYLRTELSDTLERREATLSAGRIGLATWATVSEFKDLKVTSDGEVLFTMKGLDDWQRVSGNWTYENGMCRQTDIDARAAACFGGRADWTDYTLSLKARKVSGEEGFIVIFRRAENAGLQWNVGGWGNSTHAVQLIEGESSTVLAETPGQIEQDRWYDIRIEVEGPVARCFLDDELVHKVELPTFSTPRLFASSTFDEENGQVIVKVVNAADEGVPVQIELSGDKKIAPKASVITLAGAADDENSMKQPKKVFPAESYIEDAGSEFSFTFKPYSLTVLKLRTG